MCLTTPMRRPKVAEEDIVCYKLVCRRTRGMALGSYKSYFRKFVYQLGMTYTEDDFRKDVSHTRDYDIGSYEVHYGFHSYIRRPVVTPEEWENYRYVVAKCRIPRGSWYWKGNRGGWGQEEYDEYCSDHIELVAWLDPESGEWRRPKYRVNEWPESSDISLLNGMTLDEAQDRMSERYEMHCFHGDRSTGRFWFGAKGKNIPYTGYVVWLMVNHGIVTGQW